jgi:hypothetical protein
MSANQSTIRIVLDAAEAQAGAKTLNTELNNIGAAGKAAGVSATAGLNQVEAEIVRASSSTRQYTDAERQRTAALRESSAASGNASLAEAQRRAALFNEQVALKEAQIAEKGKAMSAAETETMARRVATAERERAAAAETETISVLEAARAEQALALANLEVAETSSLTTRQMFQVGGAIDRVAGVAVPGARSIGLLAGSFSAAIIPQLLLITGISLLVGELVKLGKAKEEQIKLDDDQIKVDVARYQAMQTGTLFTKEYATVLHDQNALNAQLKQSSMALSVAQGEETDALRGYSTTARDAAANTDNLQSKVALYVYSLFASTKTETEATTARLEATKTIDEQINFRIRLAAETGKTRDALVAELRVILGETDALHGLIAALDAGALAQARMRAGQGVIGAAKSKVAEEAAEKGIDLSKNHALATHLLNVELTRQGEETYKLAQTTMAAEKNMQGFNESHKSGAAAARAYSNALVDLRKRMEESQAALVGDNFAARDAKIAIDIKAEQDHLRINKRDKEEALLYLAGREKALHDKVAQDRAIAEQRLQDEIAAIDIAGIQDAVAREEATIQRQIQRRQLDIFQEFGVTEQSEQRVLEMKEAYGRQLERFYVEESAKRMKQYEDTLKYELELERRLTDELQNEELKRTQAVLHGARDQANARTEAGKFLLSQGQGASSGQTDKFLAQLKELGPAFDDVDKHAASTKTAIDYVKNAFGFASNSAEMFQLKLDTLTGHSVTFGQTFTAIVSEMFTTVEGLSAVFQSVGQAISGVFEGLITGTENAKSAFLNFLATLLMQMGQMAIAIGTIYLFIPGYGGLGAALIAAGIGAEILAGVFKGLASNAQKAHQGAGSSAAAGGSAGAPAQAQPSPPKVISFPTSGANNSNQPVVIQLDRQASGDLLAGKQVVTMPMLRGATPNTTLGRTVKKLAS